MGISMEAFISGNEEVKVEQPLLCWANSVKVDDEVRKDLIILLQVYRLTNDCYDKRFEGVNRRNKLTDYLRVLDSNSKSCNQNKDIERMMGVVKANILLRSGQVKADSFIDPTDDYQQACIILEQLYEQREPEKADFLEFLIQLNLGKYFRNMGMYMHRSDYYWRAYDEFENILDKVAKNQKDDSNSDSEIHENQSWRAFIWLEAAMNLSRSELYLYNLKNAKRHLWNIYEKTACEIIDADSSVKKIFLGYEKDEEKKHLFPPKKLDLILECGENGGSCKTNSKMRQEYAVQALLQLGIAFRKTRDYSVAREIFAAILCEDSNQDNVDALNNYAVCLRKCGFNLHNISKSEKTLLGCTNEDWKKVDNVEKTYNTIVKCHRQGKNVGNNIKTIFQQNVSDTSETSTVEGTAQEDDSNRNRFATIEYIRSVLQKNNLQNEGKEEIQKLFESLLGINSGDKEVLLQKGLFLQMKGKYAESSEIFRMLYSEAPQIEKGTIGLKAYYNWGCNLLAEGKPYEAVKYFEKIQNEIPSAAPADRSEHTGEIDFKLDDLPGIDLPAEINVAWCLMLRADYGKARIKYRSILERYKGQIDRLGTGNEMKIRNNLVECCLQLLAYYSTARSNPDNVKIGDPLGLIKDIETCFASIEKKEPQNATSLRHRGYYHLLWGNLCQEDSIIEYEKAMDYFEKAGVRCSADVYIYSGWVTAAYEWFRAEYHSCDSKVFDRVGKRLRYVSGPYALKSCAKLSEILDSINTRLNWPQAEKDTLFRSIARIQLSPKEDGFNLFQDLRENEYFCGLKAVERGRLLVMLFQLYGKIIEIKDLCRYNPSQERNKPVHYRSISHLKRYLNESEDKKGRFSLWNIAYMNDYLEGTSFNKILKTVGENMQKEQQNDEALIDRIVEYYSQFSFQRTEGKILPFGEKNIYIASLSLQTDVIPMWVAYADNAKGCALTYSEEFFGLRHMDDFLTDVSSYSGDDFPLYRVHYYDENTEGNSEAIQKIKKITESIIEIVLRLNKYLNSMLPQPGENKENPRSITIKNVINEFVRGCLCEVRFLVKDAEYKTEEEVRMIHYSKEHQIETKHSKIPRFYIEIDRDVTLDEVTLGPKVSEHDRKEIEIWLNSTGKVKQVKASQRHYR